MTPIQTAVLDDLKDTFGITPTRVTPITGGYLNKKWKLETADCAYVLKLFSPARYTAQKLDSIEQALQRQKTLYDAGISCPRVYDCGGVILRRVPTFLPALPDGLDNHMTYMLMSFEDGDMPTPQTVTLTQMTALGEVCAAMHNVLAAIDPTDDSHYPLDSETVVHSIAAHRASLDAVSDLPLKQIDAILQTLDVPFFERQTRQLCHEDLSADNLLFCGDTPILLDFDRGQYSFPLHDVGRVLLSLAFDGTALRHPLVRAFAAGYRRQRPLDSASLADALRITFACEFSWWIRPEYLLCSEPKVHRFVREMLYLIRIWDQIPNILQGD